MSCTTVLLHIQEVWMIQVGNEEEDCKRTSLVGWTVVNCKDCMFRIIFSLLLCDEWQHMMQEIFTNVAITDLIVLNKLVAPVLSKVLLILKLSRGSLISTLESDSNRHLSYSRKTWEITLLCTFFCILHYINLTWRWVTNTLSWYVSRQYFLR